MVRVVSILGQEALHEHQKRCGVFKIYCKSIEGLGDNRTIIAARDS